MKTHQAAQPNLSSPPPFPEGWYFIGSRQSILKAKLIEKTWMGEKIVVWCDDTERICVARSVCPHLGSDLGPAAGGRVCNGRLICPFHGYQYDTTGRCVATAYAPAPEETQLRVFETQEVLGLVFAWWGSGGRPPQWHLPDAPPTGADWCEFGFRTMKFAGHPQETTENSVDIAHLRYVHGYNNVHPVGTVSVEGPCLKVCFDFRRVRTTLVGIKTYFDVSAIIYIYGLGYSLVHFREHSIGMDARLWVLTIPIDGKHVEITLVSHIRELRKPKRLLFGLCFIPLRWRTRIMNQIIVTAQQRDVQQDAKIWGRKQYQPHPRLCSSDGEIEKYRRYCKQFYQEYQDSRQDGHGGGLSEYDDPRVATRELSERRQ